MARGGRRQGTPGQNYGNRKDLQMDRKVAPGQTYGKGAAQERAMAVVPAAAPPGPAAPVAAPPADPMTSASTGWEPLAGDPTQTARPGEPVTAGLDIGAGPGSEVLPSITPPPNEDMRRLIRMLPLLETMANNSGSSAQTRNLYRQVLAAYLAAPGGE